MDAIISNIQIHEAQKKGLPWLAILSPLVANVYDTASYLSKRQECKVESLQLMTTIITRYTLLLPAKNYFIYIYNIFYMQNNKYDTNIFTPSYYFTYN